VNTNDQQNSDQRNSGPELFEPSDEADSLRVKAAELQDRLLRTQAELENYRKRARRELEDERRYAEIELIRDLLPVVDNVGRAIAAAEKQADAALLLSGLKMMQQQLEEVFQKHHAKVITAAGEPFDPSRHEAIMQQPSEEHPEHTVLGVARQGLTLHDRVVRPAQVIVSAKPKSAQNPNRGSVP
jgi:molecular chaperone GrpE